MSVVDLFARSEPRLRVIFSPLDEPTYETVAGLVQLFRHYSIPSDFLSERIQSVTHSFGSEKDSNNWNCSWFHFLCKNVTVRLFEGLDPQIVNPHHDSLPQSQADWSWIRAGFFLKWLPSQGPNSSNQSCVTLICFGASIQLQQRFERLASNSAWRDAVSDPYNLFVIILDELFLQMDGIVWNLSDTFRAIEEKTLDRAHSRDPTDEMDFVGLHNVAKHIIFLKEGSDAILLTLENMLAHHKHLLETGSSSGADAWEATQVRLKYKDGLFQSVSLRVTSLDKRMQNIINLSFNLATQQDSRVVQRDSFSMKTIAAVTLFFLPISTTAVGDLHSKYG
ncbi:hypothetical protein V498_07911 [Pseudogymnoascus sp. VKM F-4517 (FW-2822)]|nr:hypothetical protein V498_07911 [Pseudogymnoascus sp. VKM F-4517 (FW-2822)]